LQIDGSQYSVEKIPTFRVSVASVEYAPSNNHDEFPTYMGNWDVHVDVTDGKLGGLCASDAY
jgi:hypothetical protein